MKVRVYFFFFNGRMILFLFLKTVTTDKPPETAPAWDRTATLEGGSGLRKGAECPDSSAGSLYFSFRGSFPKKTLPCCLSGSPENHLLGGLSSTRDFPFAVVRPSNCTVMSGRSLPAFSTSAVSRVSDLTRECKESTFKCRRSLCRVWKKIGETLMEELLRLSNTLRSWQRLAGAGEF